MLGLYVPFQEMGLIPWPPGCKSQPCPSNSAHVGPPHPQSPHPSRPFANLAKLSDQGEAPVTMSKEANKWGRVRSAPPPVGVATWWESPLERDNCHLDPPLLTSCTQELRCQCAEYSRPWRKGSRGQTAHSRARKGSRSSHKSPGRPEGAVTWCGDAEM